MRAEFAVAVARDERPGGERLRGTRRLREQSCDGHSVSASLILPSSDRVEEDDSTCFEFRSWSVDDGHIDNQILGMSHGIVFRLWVFISGLEPAWSRALELTFNFLSLS